MINFIGLRYFSHKRAFNENCLYSNKKFEETPWNLVYLNIFPWNVDNESSFHNIFSLFQVSTNKYSMLKKEL